MVEKNSLEELRKVLNVAQLPAMPHSALSVLQLDNDLAKVDINDLVRPIEADPGLASQVLKFMNSSYFGFQNAISNVKQGIALVGIRIVKNFVLWKAVFSLIPKSKNNYFDVSLLWQDSLRRAMFSRFILTELRKGDPELAFAGALLQDMAVPILMKQKPQEYADFFAILNRHPGQQLSMLEKNTFGWTHADAAGMLSRNWKLPEALCDLIENHLLIETLIRQEKPKPSNNVVALSSMMPIGAEEDWAEKTYFMGYFERLFPDQNDLLAKTFAKLDKEYEQYASILQLPQPKRTMMSYF